MNIVKHAEGIYEVEEFLSKSEQDVFLDCAIGDGWIKSHPGSITKDMDIKSLFEMQNINTRIEDFFINMDSTTSVNKIRRLTVNESMPTHKDGGDPNDPRYIVFGIAIYLNDDFSGGELRYPDLDLVVTPKQRSMVVHDATLRHRVLPVKSGNRYSITTFIFGDEYTKFNSVLA
jgi:hypothetical protein